MADLPYGQSASIPLARGTKHWQGDKLSSLRLGLVFNCLLLVLRATGIAHRLMTGLRTPARGFADDLVLCTESPEDMKRNEASGYTNSRQSSCTTLSVN